MNHRKLVSILNAVALCGLVSACELESEDNIDTTTQEVHDWNGYHWARTANPMTLKVIDSMTSEWQAAFDGSIDTWTTIRYSLVNILDFNVYLTDTDRKTRKRCQAVAGQMHVCNASYGRNGWLGLAQIWLDNDGHIVQGVAKMNDTYASSWDVEGERNHVVCQEIGHVFGLGHTTTDGSSQETCMDYSRSVTSQWPNAHDYDMLATIYADLDTYNSFDDSVGGGDDGGDGGDSGSCNAPPGKGCNKSGSPSAWGVSQGRHGRGETFVKDHADGTQTVTHVIWAD